MMGASPYREDISHSQCRAVEIHPIVADVIGHLVIHDKTNQTLCGEIYGEGTEPVIKAEGMSEQRKRLPYDRTASSPDRHTQEDRPSHRRS